MGHSIDLQRYPEESNLTCSCRATIKSFQHCKLMFMSTTSPTFNQLEQAIQYNYRLCKGNRDSPPNEWSPLCKMYGPGRIVNSKVPTWALITSYNVLFKLLDLKFLLVLPQTADKLSRSGSPVNSCTTCTVLIYNI